MSRWLEGIHLVDVIAVAAVVWLAWSKVVVPAWKAARWGVHEADDRDVLKEIAKEFRPNAGHSLRDIIDTVRLELAEIRDEQRSQRNLINTYLLDRRRGGRRHYDTEGEEDSLWDGSDIQE